VRRVLRIPADIVERLELAPEDDLRLFAAGAIMGWISALALSKKRWKLSWSGHSSTTMICPSDP